MMAWSAKAGQAYLERREIHPEKYKLPPGSYTPLSKTT